MANLSALHIKKAPACFAEMKDMHNALCNLVGSMEGSLGIDVKITPPTKKPPKKGEKAAKPKGGKIRVTPKKTAGQKSATGSGSGGTASELHYSAGGVTIDIDGDGITGFTSAYSFDWEPTTGDFTIVGNGWEFQLGLSAQLFFTNSGTGKRLAIDTALLTHDMDIRTLTVCNSGSPGSILVPCSAVF